jgi:hypothetical protein
MVPIKGTEVRTPSGRPMPRDNAVLAVDEALFLQDFKVVIGNRC